MARSSGEQEGREAGSGMERRVRGKRRDHATGATISTRGTKPRKTRDGKRKNVEGTADDAQYEAGPYLVPLAYFECEIINC